MKKNFIFEELVDPSSLTTLKNLNLSAIKGVKTDNELLTDINDAASKQNQTVTINTSNGNSVGITNFVYLDNNYSIDVSKVKEDPKLESDYGRVKYFTDMLKKKGYLLNSTGSKVINWGDGKMTITKTDDKVTKPETDKNKDEKSPEETSKYAKDADNILKALTSDKIGQLSPLGSKPKEVQTESIVTEEINRIKQLMK